MDINGSASGLPQLRDADQARIFDVTGRLAVVTGAGGGLGAEFSRVLAAFGASVLCADKDLPAASRTADRLATRGYTATAVELDVSDESNVAAVFEAIRMDLGGVDILVNNAGIGDPRAVPLHEVSTNQWRNVLGVNLDGVFFCSRAVLPGMLERGNGKIINVASMYGLLGSRSTPVPVYATSKGAVVNLTREMGLEYAQSNIQVNALCPGFVRTGLAGGVYENPDFIAGLVKSVPMGRIPGPNELAGALMMLASSASDFMTGQVLVVDGGYSAG